MYCSLARSQPRWWTPTTNPTNPIHRNSQSFERCAPPPACTSARPAASPAAAMRLCTFAATAVQPSWVSQSESSPLQLSLLRTSHISFPIIWFLDAGHGNALQPGRETQLSPSPTPCMFDCQSQEPSLLDFFTPNPCKQKEGPMPVWCSYPSDMNLTSPEVDLPRAQEFPNFSNSLKVLTRHIRKVNFNTLRPLRLPLDMPS